MSSNRTPTYVTETTYAAAKLKAGLKVHAVTGNEHIIGNLGEEQLLLPSRINAALAANGRAKYLLTLLQTARYRAENRSG